MGAIVPIIVVTGFWLAFGGLGSLIVYCGNKRRLFNTDPNTSVILTMLILTSLCCWLFWLLCFMAQMNPQIGPMLKPEMVATISCQWFGKCIPCAPKYGEHILNPGPSC
eukprot:m.307645 g.307645  ORF g.307645 m.307645 type:complete len:109 (+) comp42575_c0_seq1:50-376(+)